LLWIVSGATAQNTVLVKKIQAVMCIVLLAWGIDELIFFFPFAASLRLLPGY